MSARKGCLATLGVLNSPCGRQSRLTRVEFGSYRRESCPVQGGIGYPLASHLPESTFLDSESLAASHRPRLLASVPRADVPGRRHDSGSQV